jgi:hypothetical protein
MDEDGVRERAQALCDALVVGDVGLATQDFSEELRHNLGEVIALFPLPANDASIESVEHGMSGYTVVIRIAGEMDEVMIQTRWKDRAGKATLVEASHLSRTVLAAEAAETGEAEAEADAQAG